tara:strand:+ start:271 stop:432 length:162 start_codon:yes stop_codon:yes gene_type:complete
LVGGCWWLVVGSDLPDSFSAIEEEANIPECEKFRIYRGDNGVSLSGVEGFGRE